jgi:hypothetical protein
VHRAEAFKTKTPDQFKPGGPCKGRPKFKATKDGRSKTGGQGKLADIQVPNRQSGSAQNPEGGGNSFRSKPGCSKPSDRSAKCTVSESAEWAALLDQHMSFGTTCW